MSARGAPQPSHPNCLGLLLQGKALTWIPELAQQGLETGAGEMQEAAPTCVGGDGQT